MKKFILNLLELTIVVSVVAIAIGAIIKLYF
jgi:hypothetical protein